MISSVHKPQERRAAAAGAAPGRCCRAWWCALAIAALQWTAAMAATGLGEYQVKAVFVFNFTQFVQWPPSSFANDEAPFVIGIVGENPFGSHLEEAVRGEKVAGRPIVVRHFASLAEVAECQVLYIGRKAPGARDPTAAARATLTVTDADDVPDGGVMIRLVNDRQRIRLRIDVESARSAGLVISSKLLRPAEIVRRPDGGRA